MRRLIEKHRLNVLLMTSLLIFSKALNVTLVGCNLKWSPLAGMFVQSFTKLLRIIMIGMNMCFKGLCEAKHIFV